MGSDMSKPKNKNKNNNIYSSNQNQLIRTPPNANNGKHLICKEIDIVQPQQQQQQQCQDPAYPSQQLQQPQIQCQSQPQRRIQPQPIHVPIPSQACSPQVNHLQPYNTGRDAICYDQFSPAREDFREIYRETEVVPHNQYHMSPTRTRHYYEDQSSDHLKLRSDKSERVERYRTQRTLNRRERFKDKDEDDDYIERYELPIKDPSRSYKPTTYQYYDDFENQSKTQLRYRSKSSDKYIETKDYSQFDDPLFNAKYEKVDSKNKLQSRSVYFIKDANGESYECTPSEVNRYRSLYDSRSNLNNQKQSRSQSTARSHNIESSRDTFGYKGIGENLLVGLPKTQIPNDTLHPRPVSTQAGTHVPVVSVVSNNNDIVYVPMVKTEFIKRESQKIENLGQMAYQSQAYHQDHHTLSTTKSDIKKLSKSHVSMHNIESTLKDELDTHSKNSINKRNNNSDDMNYKPILKKSPNSELDSDSNTSSQTDPANRSRTLRDKLNSEFHQVRSTRNYFNNINYKSGNFSGSNSNEGLARI